MASSDMQATNRDTLEKQLESIKDSLELVALALTVGLPVRLLGGGITEGDVRQLAAKKLKRLLESG